MGITYVHGDWPRAVTEAGNEITGVADMAERATTQTRMSRKMKRRKRMGGLRRPE
jgi:hypothetical protein